MATTSSHQSRSRMRCKGRYEVRGNTVRATYGHTVEIELDLPTKYSTLSVLPMLR